MEHMFPNLQSLVWFVRNRSWLLHVHLFLCPRIKYLSLGVLTTPAHLALLPTLPTRCPLLKSITLSTAKEFDVGCRLQTVMICGVKRLVRLNVGSIDQTAFEHLALLPTLEALTIQHTPEFVSSLSTPGTPKFPCLRALTLGRVSHQFFASFIAMNDTWSLQRIDVSMISTPTTAETAGLHDLLAARCDPTVLTELDLDAVKHTDALPVDELAGKTITFDALRPLLPFHGLRELSLTPPAGVSLDDVGIEALARAWPRMCSLQLRGSCYRAPPSRVTLRGLRAVARHCQDLVVLVMPFDASVVPKTDDVPPDAEKGNLQWIDVDDAILVDPAAVAPYLFGVFPQLKIIRTAREDAVSEVQERAEIQHGLWKMVEKLRPSAMARDDDVFA